MKFAARLIQLVLGMLVIGSLMYPVAAYDPFSSNTFKSGVNLVPVTKITPSFDSGFKTNSLKIANPLQITTITPLSSFSTNAWGFTNYFTKIPKIEIPKFSRITSTFPSIKQMTTFNPVSYFNTPSYTSSSKLISSTFKPISSTFTSVPKSPSYQRSSFSSF